MFYPKVPSLFMRQEEKPHKLVFGQYREHEFQLLKDHDWIFTEKLDGTNIRVIWDGHRVQFGGRTANSQISAHLVRFLNSAFYGPANEQVFEQVFGNKFVILYGEGIGPKIQNGSKYSLEHKFVLFDVWIDGIWLTREDVRSVANQFDIEIVPTTFIGPLLQAYQLVKDGHNPSEYGEFEAEGIVGVPVGGFLNRKGERIMVKIKAEDFA